MVESQSAGPGRSSENEKTVARDATDTLAPNISPLTGGQIGPKIHSQTLLNGRFLLESLLGQGGMGEVWLGVDQVLARPVAAKIIRPHDPGTRDRTLYDTSARESFINEARIGANLLHPAIATVFDFGFHEGEPFIVFEYLPGETLRTLIERRRKLSVEDSRFIIGRLAQALDFAHGNHIVHRDLKPDNIRATRQGHFKILDLGLAKEFRKSVDWESFSGTPAYTSPEQASGLPCDGRADQYALAIIAYELMTGHRPFISDDWKELVRMQREAEPPSPHVHAPELPRSICDALLRGLAKDPNKRFPSCEEFATAIGCQLLTDPIAIPQLLRVARVKKRGRGHRFVFNKSRLKAFLGQSQDSFWVSDQDEIRSLPLCDMKESGGGFRTLKVTFIDAAREHTESFEFSSGARCDEWKQSLWQLRSELPEGAARRKWTVSFPILSMGRAPSVRHQILGPVEYVGADDAESAAGVEFQAAIMDADAIVNLQQERLPDLRETMYRHSGLAIRVVDLEGRRELQSRRLAMELSRASKLMWGLPLAAMVTAMPWILTLDVLPAVILGFFVILWPVVIVRLARRLLWPQLVWPAAVSVLAVGLMPAAEWIAALIYVGVNARWNYLLPTLFGAANLVITGFALYLARRYLRVHNGYKAVYADSGLPTSDVRRARSRAAAGVSILYLILVVSMAAVHKYNTLSAAFRTTDAAEASRKFEEGVNESKQQPPALDKAVDSYQLALQQWRALGDANPAPSVCRLSFQWHGTEYAVCLATLINERDLLTNASCVQWTSKDKSPTAVCGGDTKSVTLTRVHEGSRNSEAFDSKKPDDQVLLNDNMAIFSLAKGDSFKVIPAKVEWHNRFFLSRCSVVVYNSLADTEKNKMTMIDIPPKLIGEYGSAAKLIASDNVAKNAAPVGAPLFCKDYDNNEVLTALISAWSLTDYVYTRVDQNVDFINPPAVRTTTTGNPRPSGEQH